VSLNWQVEKKGAVHVLLAKFRKYPKKLVANTSILLSYLDANSAIKMKVKVPVTGRGGL
jgi:hypothetical protein